MAQILQKQIEPELLAPPPRRVKRRGTRGLATVFCQFLTLAVGAMALFLLFWGAHMAWVRQNGPVVPATILNRILDRDSDGKPLHFVVYRYTWQGRSYERRNIVPPEVFEQTAPGATVPAQISPLWPGFDSLLLLPGVAVWRDVAILLIGSVIIWAGAGALVWYIFVLPARNKKLVERGTPVVGRVTGKRFEQNSKAAYYYVEYEYRPVESDMPGGRTATQRVGEADYNSIAKNAVVTVLYDPQRPRRSIVYEFADFKAVEAAGTSRPA